MLESAPTATHLDLISYLRSIPDARMRRGVLFPAWYLLLVAVLGILSGCQSLRDLERFAIRHHVVLTEVLGDDLRQPPADSSPFRVMDGTKVKARAQGDEPRADAPGREVAGVGDQRPDAQARNP